MRRKPVQHFHSWEEVFTATRAKKIHQKGISSEEFLSNLKTIQSVSHRNFFNSEVPENVLSILNQIYFYKEDDKKDTIYSFINDCHKLAGLINELSQNPSSSSLFRKKIFSQRGMYFQFLMTVYISRYLEITDMEVNNIPINTDILVRFKDKNIHFHVKDIQEENKYERTEDVLFSVNHILEGRCKPENFEDKILHISKIEGSPPTEANENYWINFANKIKLDKHTAEVLFKPENGYTFEKDYSMKIHFDWRPRGSHTYISPLSEFSNEKRLKTTYDAVENKIGKINNNTDVHILLVITDDEYEWESFRQNIDSESLGLLFCSIHGFYIQNSPIMLPSTHRELDKAINSYFPSSIPYWTTMSDRKL